MNLLDSAKVFLVASLDDYSRKKITFSILHAMIAVELLLKERLNRVDDELIFRKDKSGKARKDRTVDMREIPRLLATSEIVLSESESSLIRKVGNWRNAIVHHVPTHDNQAAKAHLDVLYNFIIRFLKAQLGVDVKDFLGGKHFAHLQEDITELKGMADAARQKAHDSGRPDDKYACSECDRVGVVEIGDEENAYCHYCEMDLVTAICAECESAIHSYKTANSCDEKHCADCIERAGDLYIERLIDQQRAK